MDWSTPGFPVLHHLPQLAQTQVHWVSDAIQHLILFSSCLLTLPASGSFLMSQLFASGGQSIGASASASVLPMIQCWFPWGLTGLISLQSKGLSRVFSNTRVQKHQFFGTQLSSQSNSHIHTLITRVCCWIRAKVLRPLFCKWRKHQIVTEPGLHNSLIAKLASYLQKGGDREDSWESLGLQGDQTG